MKKETKGTVGHQGVRWPTTIWMIVFHLGAVAALFYWSWRALIVSAVLAWVAQSLGVGMTYHRLLTHRSYQVPKPVEYFLIICATLSFEVLWVLDISVSEREHGVRAFLNQVYRGVLYQLVSDRSSSPLAAVTE